MKNTVHKIDEKGIFSMIDYSNTHNQILYRSHDTESKTNTDILFSGVRYMELPLRFNNCRIHLCNSEEYNRVNESFSIPPNNKVFVIEQGGFKHYVVADNTLIQKNTYDHNETSIPIKREGPMLEDDILRIVTNVESQIKEQGGDWLLKNLTNANSEWKVLI